MTLFLFIVSGGLFVVLIVLASIQPAHSKLSHFELTRRQKMRDQKADAALGRERVLAQTGALRAPMIALLLIAITALLIYLLDWTMGLLVAVVIGLLYGRTAHLSPLRRVANRLYLRREGRLLGFVSRHESKLSLLSGKVTLKDTTLPIGSAEELAHLLELSHIFSEDDKRLLQSALRFKERTVKEVMIPRDEVISVQDTELLGPLVLDDLHKTGHTIFPVTKGERIVGLLDSTDHVVLRSMESVHVRSVMQGDIVRVDQTTALDEVLKIFTTTRQPLLIVVDEEDQEVGIISLGDIIRSLTGWRRR